MKAEGYLYFSQRLTFIFGASMIDGEGAGKVKGKG